MIQLSASERVFVFVFFVFPVQNESPFTYSKWVLQSKNACMKSALLWHLKEHTLLWGDRAIKIYDNNNNDRHQKLDILVGGWHQS